MSANDDRAAALGALPHGSEFRFIDEVTELVPGQRGTGTYRVRGTEAFLTAHFPDDPMMPGVILIEAIAQLGGVVACGDPSPELRGRLRLAAVTSAKIVGTARPGDRFEVNAEIEGRLGGLVQVSGIVSCDGKPLASAKVVLSAEALPQPTAL